jgi:hypothetical protein
MRVAAALDTSAGLAELEAGRAERDGRPELAHLERQRALRARAAARRARHHAGQRRDAAG